MWEIFERLCKEKGVSAYRVSEETGIKTSALSAWKNGRYKFKQEKLQKIADYFGVSIEYLMTGEEPEEKRYYINDETSEMMKDLYDRRDLRTLFSLAKNCTEDQVDVLVKMAETWNK